MDKLTFPEFVIKATDHYRQHRNDLRFGQAVFNCLHHFRPDIANKLRGTDLDPFHRNSVPDRVWAFINTEW